MESSDNYQYNADPYYKPKKDNDTKKRKTDPKVVKKPFFAFSFIAMLAVLGATVYLSGQSQDNRQRASDSSNDPVGKFSDLTVAQDIESYEINSVNSIKVEIDNLGGASTKDTLYPENSDNLETFNLYAVLIDKNYTQPVTISNFNEVMNLQFPQASLTNLKALDGKDSRIEQLDFTVNVSNYSRVCIFVDSEDQVLEIDENNNVVCLNL